MRNKKKFNIDENLKKSHNLSNGNTLKTYCKNSKIPEILSLY